MKRVIFATYDDINQTDDKWGRASFQVNQINDYFDRLVKNKQDYAESIGVKFILFYNTMNNFDVAAGFEFAKVNLYKHHLMAELAEDFDEVMYVDMDVLFNTTKNVFEELDLSKGIHVRDQDYDILNKEIDSVVLHSIGQRNPTLKYHITKDLLDGKDCHVINTGIMIGKSQHIKSIKFIDRLPEIINKIDKLKYDSLENSTYLRMYYYPNNESIFSYILEEHDIPYVLMQENWHCIVDEKLNALDWSSIEIAHIISKKFNIFFNDKTKLIYSIYIEIPDERLDNPKGSFDDPVNKSKRTQERLAKHSSSLYKNHNDYANAIGAEYLHFTRDEQYEEFFDRFPDLSEYDVVNLYKVYLLDELVKQYDLVLYVDFDVCFVDTIDAFNYLNAETCICCNVSTPFDAGVYPNRSDYFKEYNRDFRNPQSKYWNAHALLSEEFIDPDHMIFNTGIMMASKQVMDRLDYFGDIEDVISTMKELKTDSIYPSNIEAAFGYDNETIMGYKVKKNSVPIYALSETWHLKHDYNKIESYDNTKVEFKNAKHKLEMDIMENKTTMVHFISKNFGLVFDK
jgi:hypothetical protein